ncbi:lipid A export permease/ATP-binding protein MsbA [Parasulfuritortus cantonensis]|uniref:Lipid A export permease/ATP-binding protein MsbA n=1 Tax=Parasulfuritortus cantonensis TaxID=2528202 RepID=A0A4R1B450_9PROT|nr:lipid A export permease/ATP-binding protein MsbA [Parasulfuritortus cantonensis]TCJ12864.1 lipid A export permease/ATP-binding protein MsbA [Parasulfuritortus cantonensis]
MNSRTLYLRLLGYVRPYWRMFALSVFTMVLVAASEPVLPALMKPMLDGSFVHKDPAIIHWVPLALIALFVVRGIAGFVSSYSMSYVASYLVMDLRMLIFAKLLVQPVAYYDDARKGQLVATAAFNVNQLTDAATNVLTTVVRDALTVAGLIGWLFYLNWKLAIITFAIAPPAFWVFRYAGRRLRYTSREIQRNVGEITHVLDESIVGHKIVKIFDGQEYERARFFEVARRARRFAMKQTVVSQAHGPITQLLAALALATIIYIATLQAASDQTTVGGFVSFMVAMLMLSAPLKRLSGVTLSLQRGLAAAEAVFHLLDLEDEIDTGTIDVENAHGELAFEEVVLNYPGKERPALDHVNLTVRPGETVALVGGSGGGKTSLVNLIPRFYRPTGGRILLDGVDLNDIRLGSLRANIALVSQETTLFNDSVAANIAYGRLRRVSRADIERAAEAAHARDFIRELPEGFDTMIGENGVKLSGGQRQRLAIARAILKDAPILILDEATSALDTESERLVQKALENLMQGRTTLVIAHRLSTIENADRIVVLERGRITEIGSHAELLARGGTYSRLHAMQFHEEKGAD